MMDSFELTIWLAWSATHLAGLAAISREFVLAWPKRAKRYETEVAHFRRWTAGGFSVIEIRSKFGLPSRYLATRRTEAGGEIILSRHRSRRRAIDACDRASRSL